MVQFIIDNKAMFLGVALAISECLAQIPSIKANSIFEFIFNLLSKAAGK